MRVYIVVRESESWRRDGSNQRDLVSAHSTQEKAREIVEKLSSQKAAGFVEAFFEVLEVDPEED